MIANRLYLVDERLMQIIENFEPGLHQFWPIRIVLPKGEDYPAPYFILVIRRFLESCIRELTEVRQVNRKTGEFFGLGSTKKDYANITVSRDVIGDAHLWRERKLHRPDIFFSDALQAEIARQGLRIPKHHKLKVV